LILPISPQMTFTYF